MDCFSVHWPDLALCILFLVSGWIYLYLSLHKRRKFASLAHIIIAVTLVSNSTVVVNFSKCSLDSENQGLYWTIYITNLIVSLIIFSSKISIYYFPSLGLGFCSMRERGFHDYSAFLIFIPSYCISTLLYMYPAAGYPIAFCYFQVLYVILLKNIQGTLMHIESHWNSYSERQVNTIKRAKNSAFWYCQVCSLHYAVFGFEHLIGSFSIGVDAGFRLFEAAIILYTVFILRPRIGAGFCEEMLYKEKNELVRDILIVQARIQQNYSDVECVSLIVELPDPAGNLLYGKVL